MAKRSAADAELDAAPGPDKRRATASSDKEARGARNGLQQFYTTAAFTRASLERALAAIGADHVQAYWDPSAGTGDAGAAIRELAPHMRVILSDIDTSHARGDVEMTQRDALASPPTADERAAWGGAVLGGFNPPYGYRSGLAVQFIEMMAQHCEFIVMLVPAIVMRTLEIHYEELLAERVRSAKGVFYRPDDGSDFEISAVLWVGRRRAVPLELDNYASPHVHLRCLQQRKPDPTRAPAEQDSVGDPAIEMLVRNAGGSTGRLAFIRDRAAGPTMWLCVRPHGAVSGPSNDFGGISVVGNTMFFAVRRQPAWTDAVDWLRVAHAYVSQPLPRHVEWSDHRSMRQDDQLRRMDAALQACAP